MHTATNSTNVILLTCGIVLLVGCRPPPAKYHHGPSRKTSAESPQRTIYNTNRAPRQINRQPHQTQPTNILDELELASAVSPSAEPIRDPSATATRANEIFAQLNRKIGPESPPKTRHAIGTPKRVFDTPKREDSPIVRDGNAIRKPTSQSAERTLSRKRSTKLTTIRTPNKPQPHRKSARSAKTAAIFGGPKREWTPFSHKESRRPNRTSATPKRISSFDSTNRLTTYRPRNYRAPRRKIPADAQISDKPLTQRKLMRRIQVVYLRGLARCHKKLLEIRPRASGKVKLNFVVGPAGDVKPTSIKGFHQIVERCIGKQVKRWKFSPPIMDGHPTEQPFAISLQLQAR